MKRSRSALARHRQRKLQEATLHVSDVSDLSAVAAIAGAGSLGRLHDDGDEDASEEEDEAAVHQAMRVLRNVKNSVYHRAMAARALGLLMLQTPPLVARLGLEREDLLDALLQLVNYCRRLDTRSADTRRVHVNCCVVISMLMRAAQTSHEPPPQRLQLVVALDSELLAMPPRPTEKSLLLTVSGRPETSAHERAPAGAPVAPRESARLPLQPIGPLRPQRFPSPVPQHKANHGLAMQTKETAPIGKADKPSSLPREEDVVLAPVIKRQQTPSRQFKMDRFRVITPALVPSPSSSSTLLLRRPLPVIPPSRHQMRELSSSLMTGNTNQRENSPRDEHSDAPASPSLSSPPLPPSSSTLLQPHLMVEILRSGRMPVASAGYFHTHLRDDSVSRRASTPSRLQVVEWGEWRRREESDGNESSGPTERVEKPAPSSLPTKSRTVSPSSPIENIHTPEYKRARLRDILSSPIEPFPRNTVQLLALDNRHSTTTMRALDEELRELREGDARTRQQMRSQIERERDKLPLKFLFQLPGGAAYCRDRMRRAMQLWVLEFEANQKRMALLQWKAVVEQWRFRQRGAAYHRLAIEKRLKVAIEYVLRGFQQQALRKWVETVQLAIWVDRDTAVRTIQRQVRRRFGLLRFLAWHNAYPVGGPFLRDVYLSSPRNIYYQIPTRVRLGRRRLWFAAELVQGVYRKRRFRKFLQRYRMAAIRIQARARMRIQRTFYRLMRDRIICLQAHVRMHHDYRAYQTLRRAVVLVQINFRSMRIKRLRQLVVQTQRREAEYRLTATLRLQRVARGFLGRCAARQRRRECDERFHAALVVQRAWYRRNNEWSTFLLLGCLREKEMEETQFDRKILAFKRGYMAKQIQHTWQRHRHGQRTNAAGVVQRNVRRWIATRAVERMRLELLAHRRIKWFLRFAHARRVATARMLQFWWLHRVPGRLVAHLHLRRLACEASKQQEKYHCDERAATQIQSLVRGRRDRILARKERSALVLQKAARAFLVWRRMKRELARLKANLALQQTQQWVRIAFERVFAVKMARLSTAATHIQRFTRGFLWRVRLVRVLVETELRDRMARRIQSRWKRNAQSRLAKRVISAQRRRRENPFRDCNSVARVLHEMRGRASELFDPEDELRGLHMATWLRRLGLNEEVYYPLLQKVSNAGNGSVSALRACGGPDECLRLLERIGVADEDDAQRMATNVFAAQTLRDVRTKRSQVETLSRVQRDEEKRAAFAQQQLDYAKLSKQEAEELLEEVLREAADFRNPPKALRAKREKLTVELDKAQQSVAVAQQKHRAIKTRVTERKREIAKLQHELSEREKDEVSAVYSLENFRPVHSLSVARELFLRKFPGLEARALAFVGALEEDCVSTWQLLAFFQANGTIAQVKMGMPRLTYFKFATDVKKHDHARFQACSDLLQYGFDRLGELLAVPVDHVVLGTTSPAAPFLSAMVVQTIRDAQRCRQPSERAVLWTQRAHAIAHMDAVATRVQCQWRRRGATRVMQLLRSTRRKQQLRDEYLEEVRADYVTPIWQDERDQEKREYEEWLRDEARAAREEALEAIVRFPWREEWDDASQSWVVYRVHAGGAEAGEDYYEYASDRPVYSVEEEDAVVVMQSVARRFLARSQLYERRRRQRRAEKRNRMERQWLSRAAERAQTLTLKLQVGIAADASVSLWISHRERQQKQKEKLKDTTTKVGTSTAVGGSPSNKRLRKKAVPEEDEEKRNAQNAETVAAFGAQLARAAVLQPCEATYHRSVRNEHLRHQLFPATARPPNAHAQVLLDFLQATQTLQRSLSLTAHAKTSMMFTRVALPFGWREISSGDARSYYYHIATQATSWERPQYDFDAEFAAIKVQSLARVALAFAARERELDAISFVATVQTTLQRAARIGWIGFGLEGMSARVLLSRLGLAKLAAVNNATLASLSADELLRVPASTMQKKLGMTPDEITTLQTHAPPRLPHTKRTFPLRTTGRLALAPTVKHAFNILPSERVVHQLVAQSLPNQQGRVVGLVRAITQSTTPISYRQLEIHLRLYAGRPDDAVAHIGEIASLAIATQAPQETQILELLLRGLERCVVFAANLKLRGLHEELTDVMRVAAALLVKRQTTPREDGDQADEQDEEEEAIDETAALLKTHVLASPATPLARSSSVKNVERVSFIVRATRRRCVEQPIKGLWEHNAQSQSPLSAAQVALFVRDHGLERVLRWWRSAALTQATFRMHRVRTWYRAVVRHRNRSATVVQSAWRVFEAREMRRLLESQQRSPFEQQYDKLTKTFFFVYTPTREKLLDEPRDANGAMLPFRPMVQDRATTRWIQAWPHLQTKDGRSRQTQNEGDDDEDDWARDAPRCGLCHVERAVRRCVECVTSTGDFVDSCLACFYDRHAPTSEIVWHAFTPLYALDKHKARRAFHCVECKRLSTLRCLSCREHYCERCFARVHRKGHVRARHSCEYYGSGARVCVECEAHVAFETCLVCLDALCEACMARTHARGVKQTHSRERIRQPLDTDSGHVYCEHCDARRGDATCVFCARALCQVCLSDPTKHAAAACPETLLQLKTRELLGDRLCVECGKPADRQCAKCGDKYCSVKWMGNPGCFERFHYKGRRADHTSVALAVDVAASSELPREILALEEQVKQKRRRDAEAAEQEARAMAAALAEAAAEAERKRGKEASVVRRRVRRGGAAGTSKRKLLGSAAARLVCGVDGCGRATLSAAVPFCGRHLTSQHALEISRADPLEAAKLLALVEKHGGALPALRPRGRWAFPWRGQQETAASSQQPTKATPTTSAEAAETSSPVHK